MSKSLPFLIDEENLSHAWAKAFLHIIDNPGKGISPLVVSITGFNDGISNEDMDIRQSLDKCLADNDEQKIHTVANTIFPDSLWRRSKYQRHELFERYLKFLPRAKAIKHCKPKNRRGLYFERLIAFGSDEQTKVNQLEYIIDRYQAQPTARKSMFQASIFDPREDHIPNPYIPFPCLQHVSFVPQGKTLTLNAFYATQQLLNKAYGNYLGLCRLGNFMSHEMGLTFSRMNCFVGVAKLEHIGKEKNISKTSHILTPTIQVCRKVLLSRTE
ncbi:thymidylate synthase [Coleofasciculus sp. FACHB-SPT36]|uniref:thymidylate synthase n=1 Tax=Cyanophyceae TaxID=3028117 RepID=UPI00168A4BC0|nr:thymidylate synthase [Coleofasciculus sp. FACHB-SPT36]MBD2538652.1 thymidylate synthase [Coleofasciculus sp. FACHB-SPT36]